MGIGGIRNSGAPGGGTKVSWAEGAEQAPWMRVRAPGTQSKIVLHFVSKEVPLEGSIVFKGGGGGWILLSARLAVKKSSGMLARVGVPPLGERA